MTKSQIFERLGNVARQFKLSKRDDRNIAHIFNLIERDAQMPEIDTAIRGVEWDEAVVKKAVFDAFKPSRRSAPRRSKITAHEWELLIMGAKYSKQDGICRMLCCLRDGDYNEAADVLAHMGGVQL
jgi:hypothetical protein